MDDRRFFLPQSGFVQQAVQLDVLRLSSFLQKKMPKNNACLPLGLPFSSNLLWLRLHLDCFFMHY
jgi:hypothetical protein